MEIKRIVVAVELDNGGSFTFSADDPDTLGDMIKELIERKGWEIPDRSSIDVK